MKICYLTYGMDPKNGWGKYASDLIYGVKKEGHEVAILKEQDDGFEGAPILRRGPGLFVSAIKARKYLRDCDIIHALDVYPYGIIAYIANLFLGKKLVLTAQGTYSIAPLYNKKTAFLSKMVCSSANSVIAISNFTKQELVKKVGNKKIEVINHGISLGEFYKKHIETEEKFILSVGALKYRKGYHISIPAYAAARKRFPHLKYKIVDDQGDPHYFGQLKNLVAQHGIEDGIEFLSDISDKELSLLYQKAKLFILTSVNVNYNFEGFGLVFLEAAAAGLPVIGTLGNGIEDAVKKGYNGTMIPQNDIEKTAEAIANIVSDRKKWDNMSNNSYAWAEEHKLDDVIKRYISIYERTLA